MARIDFYHLQNQTLEAVLPKLLEKALDADKKVKVKIGNEERVEFINSMLWAYNDEAFLPHGSAKDGHSSMQPIFLSDNDDVPNGAEFLFLIDGASTENMGVFERVFYIFDGNAPEELAKARELWKTLKDAGNECFYWQQDKGVWKQKA